MTTADVNAALSRLALPSYRQATISQVDEAQRCTGCVASYVGDVRVVDAHPDCPVHGGDDA